MLELLQCKIVFAQRIVNPRQGYKYRGHVIIQFCGLLAIRLRLSSQCAFCSTMYFSRYASPNCAYPSANPGSVWIAFCNDVIARSRFPGFVDTAACIPAR